MSRLSIALVFIIHTRLYLCSGREEGFKLSPVQLMDEVSQIDQIPPKRSTVKEKLKALPK